jgi:hypothetical protein
MAAACHIDPLDCDPSTVLEFLDSTELPTGLGSWHQPQTAAVLLRAVAQPHSRSRSNSRGDGSQVLLPLLQSAVPGEAPIRTSRCLGTKGTA